MRRGWESGRVPTGLSDEDLRGLLPHARDSLQELDLVGPRQRLLREALNRLSLDQPGVDQSIPFGDYAQQWLDTTLAVRDVKASTRLVYADALEHWVLPTLGTRRLRDLRPSDIERLLAHLQRRGLSRNSRAMAFKVLRQVLDTAVRDRLSPSRQPPVSLDLGAPQPRRRGRCPAVTRYVA